jgi:hypothetical protein
MGTGRRGGTSEKRFRLPTLADIAKGSLGQHIWADLLRKHLYAEFFAEIKPILGDVTGMSLRQVRKKKGRASLDKCREVLLSSNRVLTSIVRLCGSDSKRTANPRIGPVLTTNIDCLLQIYDALIQEDEPVFETVNVASAETNVEKLSLYYLHGYISTEEKRVKNLPFVFTEAEYLARNDDPYSWANVTLHWAL